MMRLKELRLQHGFTEEEVAKAIGITLKTYKKYELTPMKMSLSNLIKIALFYKVRMDYILGRSDEPNYNNSDITKCAR